MDRYVWRIFRPRDVSEKRKACCSKNSQKQLNTNNISKQIQADRKKGTGKWL